MREPRRKVHEGVLEWLLRAPGGLGPWGAVGRPCVMWLSAMVMSFPKERKFCPSLVAAPRTLTLASPASPQP